MYKLVENTLKVSQKNLNTKWCILTLYQCLVQKQQFHFFPGPCAATFLDQREMEGAAAAIEALATAQADHPQLGALRARLAFVQTANAQPDVMSLRAALEANPSDAAARHALAAHHALAGDYGTALAEWLELMRRDRKFGDDAGRRALLQAFDVLGEQDPLVTHYRRRMASLLH